MFEAVSKSGFDYVWLRRYAGALSILIVFVWRQKRSTKLPNVQNKVQQELITIGGMSHDMLLLRLLRLTRSLGEKQFSSHIAAMRCIGTILQVVANEPRKTKGDG